MVEIYKSRNYKKIESIVCQGETPDLTIFLKSHLRRVFYVEKHLVPDRIESEGVNFLKSQ